MWKQVVGLRRPSRISDQGSQRARARYTSPIQYLMSFAGIVAAAGRAGADDFAVLMEQRVF